MLSGIKPIHVYVVTRHRNWNTQSSGKDAVYALADDDDNVATVVAAAFITYQLSHAHSHTLWLHSIRRNKLKNLRMRRNRKLHNIFLLSKTKMKQKLCWTTEKMKGVHLLTSSLPQTHRRLVGHCLFGLLSVWWHRLSSCQRRCVCGLLLRGARMWNTKTPSKQSRVKTEW